MCRCSNGAGNHPARGLARQRARARRRRSRHARRAARARWPRARGRCRFQGALAGAERTRLHAPWSIGRSLTASPWSRERDRCARCACSRHRAPQRRLAVLIPHYAGAPGRDGYAVGLDVPASVLALLCRLGDCGLFRRGRAGDVPRPCLMCSTRARARPCSRWIHMPRSPPTCRRMQRARVHAAWGDPASDPDVRDGHVPVPRRARSAMLSVALPPDRGRPSTRRADYHDPTLPPRHALLAFGLWVRHRADIHALVHMGAHGTLEWLPGKAVALTSSCFPEIVTGAIPVFYPFIVSNPGEAAQAKRRIAGGDDRTSAASARRGDALRRCTRTRAARGRVRSG